MNSKFEVGEVIILNFNLGGIWNRLAKITYVIDGNYGYEVLGTKNYPGMYSEGESFTKLKLGNLLYA